MKNKNNSQEYLVHVLREQLRQYAVGHTLALSRSVSRLTSCDAQPCLEYREEVQAEYQVIDRLLYAQQCRAALERCAGDGDHLPQNGARPGQGLRTADCRREGARPGPGLLKASGPGAYCSRP